MNYFICLIFALLAQLHPPLYGQGKDYYGKPFDDYSDYYDMINKGKNMKDTVINPEIFYRNIEISFILYSMQKLWKEEDSCGAKEYKLNVIKFFRDFRHINFLKINNIYELMGKPDTIFYSQEGKAKYVSAMMYVTFKGDCHSVDYQGYFRFKEDSTLSSVNSFYAGE